MISAEKASHATGFLQCLKLADDFYGQPFKLQNWQHDAVWNVYGTLTDAGTRQYRYAYLETPKKNGKTTMIAGLGLYHLVCDPAGGMIYCCAAEREQAGLTYRAACQMIEQDDELQSVIRVVASKKELHNRHTGTVMKVLSAEAYSKHGLNPTVVIFDELHAQPNRDLWDTMTFGAGAARKEPLWWVITTAGDDPDRKSIGWEIHELARRIIDSEIVDPQWYCKIYAAPDDADIFDEATWYQANPSLGVSISIETVRQEALAARNSPSSEKLFRWLRLNQWVAIKRTGWMPLTLWDMATARWNPADLVGKRCYLGLDLSSTTDITALVALFPPQDGVPDWRILFKAFIPIDNMKERIRRDKVPYDDWVRSGYLVATEGNAVDYETVQLAAESMAQIYEVKYLCADQWNSKHLTQNLARRGIKTIEIQQTMAGLSPATKQVERLIRIGQLTHLPDPVARWCVGNAVVATDGNENVKLMKDRSFERIDLAVAMVIAMAAAIKLEKKTSAYESHGIRVV